MDRKEERTMTIIFSHHQGIIDKINDTIQIILSFGVDAALSEHKIDSAKILQQSLEGKI